MSSPKATIVNVQRFSTEDGPGIRTTVFFKGCPMRCPWCHNPEAIRFEPELVWHAGRCLHDHGCLALCGQAALAATGDDIAIDRSRCRACRACVEYCPAEALEMLGYEIGVEELATLVCRDASFYEASGGGVTLSGGEPLAQPEAAVELLRLASDAGIHTAVDTCGAMGDEVLDAALEHTDLVLFDIKTADLDKHQAYTGTPFARVVAAARRIDRSGVPVWVRTPIIPGYTDDETNVRAIACLIRELFSNCQRYDLLAFSNLCLSKYVQLDRAFPLADTALLSKETMDQLLEAAREERAPNPHWSGPTRL